MCRSSFACVRQNKEFHKVIVDRVAGRLNDENILSTNTLLNHYLNLTIVEMPNKRFTELYSNTVRNLSRQLWICISR